MTLTEAEESAAATLEPELRGHGELTLRAYEALELVLEALPEVPVQSVRLSRVAATQLLVRLANDLRTAALLAIRGYPLQAATLVASMFEVAYTVAYIDGDDELARQWGSHNDPTRLFRPIRQLVRDVIAKLPIPAAEGDAAVERKYRDYRQLCLAKHVNPLLQRQHGLERQGKDIAVLVGPTTHSDAIRVGWFALEQAAGLAFLAGSALLQHHVPAGRQSEACTALSGVETERNELAQRALARGWGENPFPDRW